METHSMGEEEGLQVEEVLYSHLYLSPLHAWPFFTGPFLLFMSRSMG